MALEDKRCGAFNHEINEYYGNRKITRALQKKYWRYLDEATEHFNRVYGCKPGGFKTATAAGHLNVFLRWAKEVFVNDYYDNWREDFMKEQYKEIQDEESRKAKAKKVWEDFHKRRLEEAMATWDKTR